MAQARYRYNPQSNLDVEISGLDQDAEVEFDIERHGESFSFYLPVDEAEILYEALGKMLGYN